MAVINDGDLFSTRNIRTEIEEDIVAKALEILDKRFAVGEILSDPKKAGAYCKAKVAEYDHEVFGVMFLDTRHRILACEIMFHGTIDGAEVHPREVVRRALLHNAAACLLFHNHPSGCPEPSAADRAVTAQLKQALALIDVRLLDHFVIGAGAPVSLAMRGWV